MIKIKTDDGIEELSVKEIISHNEEIINEKIGELLMKGHSEETIEDFEQMSKIELMKLKKLLKNPETILFLDEESQLYKIKK